MARGKTNVSHRYEIALATRYRLNSGEHGEGETITIDHEKVLMRSNRQLPLGEVVEVSIAWPVLASGRDPMTLRIQGLITFADANIYTISIGKHEFEKRADSMD